jgi:hypothetical protein
VATNARGGDQSLQHVDGQLLGMPLVQLPLSDRASLAIVGYVGDFLELAEGHRHREDAMPEIVTNEDLVGLLIDVARTGKRVEAVEALKAIGPDEGGGQIAAQGENPVNGKSPWVIV